MRATRIARTIIAVGLLGAGPVAGQEPRWDAFTRALDAFAARDSVVGGVGGAGPGGGGRARALTVIVHP